MAMSIVAFSIRFKIFGCTKNVTVNSSIFVERFNQFQSILEKILFEHSFFEQTKMNEKNYNC